MQINSEHLVIIAFTIGGVYLMPHGDGLAVLGAFMIFGAFLAAVNS